MVRVGADRSYGIHVAHLAGVPESVTDRAKEIVEELTEGDVPERVSHISPSKRNKRPDDVTLNQLSLFDMNHDDDIVTELKKLDVNTMTPMDAMNTLYRLHDKALAEDGKGQG